MVPTISVLTPTISRPTLKRALDSVWPKYDATSHDEVLVIGDGDQPEAKRIVEELGFPFSYRQEGSGGPSHIAGNQLRNILIQEAMGDWIMFLDDDDTFAPNALETVREIIRDGKKLPHMFRMVYGAAYGGCLRKGDVLWQDQSFASGLVSGACFVFPNEKDNIGVWPPRRVGDFQFMSETVANFNGLVWRREIIYRVRPSDGP